jgi:sulfur carrier protein ThiS
MSEPTHPISATDGVTLTYRRETFVVRPGSTLRRAILHCKLNPETVLATRNGELITDEVILEPGDRIRLIATISGG